MKGAAHLRDRGNGLTLGFDRSGAFPHRCRILPLFLAACLLPLLAQQLPMVRLFNILSGEVGNLSDRVFARLDQRPGSRLKRAGGSNAPSGGAPK